MATGANPRGGEPGPRIGQVRILVTDDQPEMLEPMDRALGTEYECRFASSAEEARELLSGNSFELAVCNLEAAGSSGLGLAGEIVRDHQQTATIVLMTGQDDPALAQRAFAEGVYGYLGRTRRRPAARTSPTSARRSSTWRRSASTPKTPAGTMWSPITRPTSSRG